MMNETPLRVWIILEESGEVCCAHCNCMAGLGEVCTHIAAILFYLETVTRIEGKHTCTQTECEWLIPSYYKSVEYKPVKDIDFTSARGKKRKLDEMLEKSPSPECGEDSEESIPCLKHGCPPTDDDFELLFENLSVAGTKPGVLSLVPTYSDNYVPKSSRGCFPVVLKSLQEPSYIRMKYDELLEACESVFTSLTVTDEMAANVEKETRTQFKSSLWFQHRAGRVTSSRMKAVCHTNPANPAQSLVKSICYPLELRFSSKETDWGQNHEKIARDLYFKKLQSVHEDLVIADSGLVINPQWPFIAASPDGVVNCKCCEKIIIEIKCPYTHRNDSIEVAVFNDKNFCLEVHEDTLRLNRNHAYYYQVQTQMFVCNVNYCDFCVCTFPVNSEDCGLFLERIPRDDNLWNTIVTKSKQFFVTCLLPEILGNWYTCDTTTAASSQSSEADCGVAAGDEELYCYCRSPEEGTMIGCDNNDCKIEWFHLHCLHLTNAPKGKWYCPDCRKLPQFLKGKGRGKNTLYKN